MRLHAMVLTVGAVMMLLAGLAGAQENDNSEVWGSRDVTMRVTAQGAELDFACAHGAIQQPIRPNAAGEFSVPGTYTPERGGPIMKDNPPRDLPAIYKGAISGDTMHLEIILSDQSQSPPPFTLTKGKQAKVVKCR